MYGTVRFQIKPGMEKQLVELSRTNVTTPIAGMVADYVYKMDANPNEYYLAVIFESKAAYVANAQSPEQNARYQELRALMAADPEWHDGEVVDSFSAT